MTQDREFITLHQGDFAPHVQQHRSSAGSRGRNLGSFIAGLVFAKRHNATRKQAADWAEHTLFSPAVAKALNTTGTSTGGALIPQEFSDEIIELLRARTVIRRCEPRLIEMPLGNMTIPRMTGGAIAGFQDELDDIPVSQESFDDLQLNAKKLTALIPVSNDLIRRSPSDIGEIIRDDFVATFAVREDLAFLTGDGSKGSPIGLLNYVQPANSIVAAPFVSPTNASVLSTVLGVLLGLQTILKNSMSQMIRPRWIAPPNVFAFLASLRDDFGGFIFRQELEKGLLLGHPYFETQQLPSNLAAPLGSGTGAIGSQLMLVDFADVILADTSQFRIDLSETTTYPDGTGALVSTFARDLTAYRAISEFDFNMRHYGSIAVALLPGWQAPGTQFVSGSAYYAQGLSGDGSPAASTWGTPPTGSSNPGSNTAVAPGGTQAGRA